MALPEFSCDEHILKHLFQYTRLMFIVASWFMVRDHAVLFLGFICASLVINIMDRIVFSLQPRA
jgi:hypothetical protein